MVKHIIFRIDKEGQVSIEVEGAKGNSCEDLSQPFEEKLGIVSKKSPKDAYFATDDTEQTEVHRDS